MLGSPAPAPDLGSAGAVKAIAAVVLRRTILSDRCRPKTRVMLELSIVRDMGKLKLKLILDLGDALRESEDIVRVELGLERLEPPQIRSPVCILEVGRACLAVEQAVGVVAVHLAVFASARRQDVLAIGCVGLRKTTGRRWDVGGGTGGARWGHPWGDV